MNPGTVQLQSTTGRSGLVIDIYHGPYYLHFGLYTFFCHAFFPHCPLWKKTQKAWEKRKYLFYFWIVKSWRSSNCTICNLSVRWERGRVKVAVTRSKHAGTLSSIISFPTIRRRRITLHNKLPHYTCYTCFGDPFCGFCAWDRTSFVCYNKLSIFIYSLFINFVTGLVTVFWKIY